MTKKIEKYYRCDNCDKIKGVCRCERKQFTVYLGVPDKLEIPDDLAVENFMYTPPAKIKEEKGADAKMILVKFIKENIKDLMISDNDPTKVYVRIDALAYVEFYDLMGRKFLYWLKDQSFRIHEKVFSEDTFTSSISLVYAQAIRQPKTKLVHTYLRIAQTADAIFYDLCNNKHEVVKITPGNVEILQLKKDFPVFIRSSRLAPQVTPNLKLYDHALDIFVYMLSVVKEEKFLFKIHLISLFLEGLPIPICDLFSDQGKGKSQITASVKMIVDPQSGKLIENMNKMPIKEENFHLECNSKYLLGWDNVSHISASQSDDICRMVTGGATEKRMLYSNDELVVQYFMKKFTLNGIGINIIRGDYLDRSLDYSLGLVMKNERWTDEEYEGRLKSLLPSILADIFITLAKAMKIYPKIKNSFKELPRMAGFGLWGEAISQSIGKEAGVFLKEYGKISSNTLAKAGENHPLVKYVEHIMQQREAYNEPISKFYNSMKDWAESEGYDVKSKYSHFPKSAQNIRPNLQRVNGFIRELGYFVSISERDFSRNQEKRGTVYITISHLMKNVENPEKSTNNDVSECQGVTKDSLATRHPGTDEKTDFSENKISDTSTNESTSKPIKAPNTLQNFTCKNCSTNWKNTKLSLDYIQTEHSEKNKGHIVVEVPKFDLGGPNV